MIQTSPIRETTVINGRPLNEKGNPTIYPDSFTRIVMSDEFLDMSPEEVDKRYNVRDGHDHVDVRNIHAALRAFRERGTLVKHPETGEYKIKD